MLSLQIEEVQLDGKAYRDLESATNALVDDLEKSAYDSVVAVSKEMKAALEQVHRELEKRHGRAWPQGGAPFGTNPDYLSMRTGRGLRSIRDSIKVEMPSKNEAKGQISTGRLTVHETGVTIRARNVKYLTLPMIQALDSRGLPRRASARDWPNTFVAQSKRGNLIIFQKQTGGRIIPLYMLKREVKIPKRLGMGEAFQRSVPYFMAKAIDAIERQF